MYHISQILKYWIVEPLQCKMSDIHNFPAINEPSLNSYFSGSNAFQVGKQRGLSCSAENKRLKISILFGLEIVRKLRARLRRIYIPKNLFLLLFV